MQTFNQSGLNNKSTQWQKINETKISEKITLSYGFFKRPTIHLKKNTSIWYSYFP